VEVDTAADMEVEVTLAEATSEGSTEAGCQTQVVRSGLPRISLLEARKRADSQNGMAPGQEVDCRSAVKRLGSTRKLQVGRAWPAITVVRSSRRLAGQNLLFAVPRQIAMNVR
jgi:hypothetical protein